DGGSDRCRPHLRFGRGSRAFRRVLRSRHGYLGLPQGRGRHRRRGPPLLLQPPVRVLAEAGQGRRPRARPVRPRVASPLLPGGGRGRCGPRGEGAAGGGRRGHGAALLPGVRSRLLRDVLRGPRRREARGDELPGDQAQGDVRLGGQGRPV
ncbi:MAG: hypothetical protein AVDCRST_MAG80-1586, partial [uncultured Rubrobacteraceae bacterium]